MIRCNVLLLFAISILASVSRCHAHFPWLSIDEHGNVVYSFGETPAETDYKLPESIQAAAVTACDRGKSRPVKLKSHKADGFIGLTSVETLPARALLASKVTYGVYHGSRLEYYTQYVGAIKDAQVADYKSLSGQLDLYAKISESSGGVEVQVVWKGEPLAGANVRLFCAEGHEEGSATTDDKGRVAFSSKQVEDGLNGIIVGHKEAESKGRFQDQEYSSISHYLTSTFYRPDSASDSAPAAKITVTSDSLPTIPVDVTSFGAAVAGRAVYIYGGHTGGAHQYYAEAQAKTLWKLDLDAPKSWQALGDGPGLQGLAMVAHGDKLYRLGGFTARNSKGKDKSLWSQATASVFDTEKGKWTEMEPMPEPRSSFDAVVVNDSIYVIGGWSMQGDETKWSETAYRLDLNKSPLKWKAIAAPPFQRRALSVAAANGKVYAIGGMQKSGGPTTRVDVFDTKSQTWSQGPSLNGEGMDGFGSSSFALGDEVYSTTYSGDLQRLSADGKSWVNLHLLERDRFFHRLLPLSKNQLLSIGGASMTSGKFSELDVITIE